MLLYIMLAYLLLLAALSNAACLHNAFMLLIFENAFCFHALSWFFDTVCLFQGWFCIMHCGFNLLVFPNSMFTPFYLCERAMFSLEK